MAQSCGLLDSKLVQELGGCSSQHSKQLGCGGFIVCDVLFWLYLGKHHVVDLFMLDSSVFMGDSLASVS